MCGFANKEEHALVRRLEFSGYYTSPVAPWVSLDTYLDTKPCIGIREFSGIQIFKHGRNLVYLYDITILFPASKGEHHRYRLVGHFPGVESSKLQRYYLRGFQHRKQKYDTIN